MCLHFNANININPVEILSATWKAASRPCGYLRNPEPKITSMDGAMDKLRSLRMDIEERIRSAELAGQTPIHQVRDWLAKVSDVDAKVSKLKDDCQNGYANWRINRRVRKRMSDIAALQDGGAFENVADKRMPPPVQEVNDAERPKIPSTNRYLSQLQAYLQDDDNGSRIIGIWGMGGVGKTTLLKCLNNELHSSLESGQTSSEFDHVIWAVVSKDYKIENLQRDVAERLGLPSHEDRAKQARVIFDFLKHRSFLLLLDDLWQPLDFTEVGFPHPLRAKTSGPKQMVVFTTRLERVCGKMQARRILKLECLNEEEAWQLFQDKVGEETLRAHAMIHQLARRVVNECHGLPLAIVVIGAAMSTKKTPMEWHNAIALLEKSRLSEIPDIEEDNFLPKLKFSYDNLADEVKQKCFLLCCLWKETFTIKKSELIECWMGHGLVDMNKFYNINEAYDSGHALINNFLSACLLEPGENPDKEVKMHDVVRNLALWIASNYGEKPNKFIVKYGDDAFEDKQCEVERMSLSQFRDIGDFPSNCLKLETLILRDSFSIKSIPTGFFKGTPALAYLDLSGAKIYELTSEISLLSNLQYLNLSGTYIRSLPLQLNYLRELRFLILRRMPRGIIISDGLIENFEMLSVIDMSHTLCKNWKEVLRLRGPLKGVGIRLMTTESLKHVQHSNVPIWKLELRGLVGFKGPLQLGSLNNQSSIQRLDIRDCESLKVMSIGSLPRLEKLAISGLLELKNIIFRGVVPTKMMPSLTKLTISRSDKLLHISWVIRLPSLAVLIVSNCSKMKQVIIEDSNGDIHDDENALGASESSDAFPSLKEIRLRELPRLRMFADRLLAFPLLEILEVRKCPEMKMLPFGLEIIGKRLKKISGDRKWWDELEMEVDVRTALSPQFLERRPSWKNVYSPALWCINRRVRKKKADIITSLDGDSSENDSIESEPLDDEEVSVADRLDNLSMGFDLSQLHAYLQDDEDRSQIIGIWGMGGIGKTTLMHRLKNELCFSSKYGQTQSQFDHIIWAVASKEYKPENLLDDVSRQIRHPFYEDKAALAREIFNFLKHKSFLLLIDDLWQPLDFVEAGFPHPHRIGTSGPKQKVVLTTRFEEVCEKMQAGHILKLECLSEDKAWNLFQYKVGEETLRAHARIPQLARRVVEECCGIPLALTVIGAAMSTKKTPMEWQNAIALLEKSRIYEIHDMEENKILRKLKFSYDNLSDEIKQKCFLLCSLWPKDFSIKKTGLIECWMGHGLIDVPEFDDINEAYDSGYALIDGLLAACLLEPGNYPNKEVKMHDVVRDLALWIASNCGEKPNKFIVNFVSSASEDMQSKVERMSLISFNSRDNFRDLSGFLSNCSKLETLIIQSNYMFESIHIGFFKGTPVLAYLDLSNNSISELGPEIGLLSNLRYLNLSSTNIKYLPLQLGYLRKLRFLFLRYLDVIIIPDGLIEKLEMLYVIDMTSTMCKNWKEISRLGGFSKCVDIRLKTIQALQKLTRLSNVHVSKLQLSRLRGFKGPLQLGSLSNQSSIQKLDVEECKSLEVVSISPNSQRGSLSRLDSLSFGLLPKLNNIVYRVEMMPSLTKLEIYFCRKLMNISWAIRLPSLEVFIVRYCPKMKQVIDENHEGETIADENVASGGESGDAFPRLKKIQLDHMQSLKMFANGLLAFPSLEKLEVIACSEMKTLPFGLEIIEKRLKKIYGGQKWWEKLEMEEDVRAALLPLFFEKLNYDNQPTYTMSSYSSDSFASSLARHSD